MRTIKKVGTGFGLALAAALGLSQAATSGTIDAISAASFQLKGGSTTTTSATFNVYHNQENGSFRIYWDTKSQTSTSGFPSGNLVNGDLVNGSSAGGSATITKLLPGTSYFFWIQGYEGENQTKIVGKAKITGNFTTDGTSSALRRIPESVGNRSAIDPMGRQIGQQRGFAPVQIDRNGSGIQIEPTGR